MDSSIKTFEHDVIEASKDKPVLVDFWAPWCGPCRVLGPLLEKLEHEDAGRWTLVKVNSDAEPELATAWRVRGIPYVIAFADGKPVDEFVGSLPERELRAFLARVVPDPAEMERRKAVASRAQGARDEALAHYKAALALDPTHDGARIEYADCLLDDRQTNEARQHFDALGPRAENEEGYATLKAKLDAAQRLAQAPSEDTLRARIAADGGDLQARLDLANVLIAKRAFAPAMDELLTIVKRDRTFQDDVARKTLIAVFDMASADTQLVADYRRKLSSVLF